MKTIAVVATLMCFAAGFARADTAKLPGDPGRPFNGLPLPPNPPPPPPHTSAPSPRAPSLDLAIEAAKAATAACKGYHVSVTIVDASGAPKLFYVPDGTGGEHAYTALRKAFTALTFKMPTSKVGEMTRTDHAVADRITADTNLLSFAGGVPIHAGERGHEDDAIIGAIGVSGAEPSEKDEECAIAGMEKVQARLK